MLILPANSSVNNYTVTTLRNAASCRIPFRFFSFFPPVPTLFAISPAGSSRARRTDFTGNFEIFSVLISPWLFLASYIWVVDAACRRGLEDLGKNDAGESMDVANSILYACLIFVLGNVLFIIPIGRWQYHVVVRLCSCILNIYCVIDSYLNQKAKCLFSISFLFSQKSEIKNCANPYPRNFAIQALRRPKKYDSSKFSRKYATVVIHFEIVTAIRARHNSILM